MKVSSRTVARAKAFTLVELLVVVAIVAILAALLFPALSKATASNAALGFEAQLWAAADKMRGHRYGS